MNRILVFFLGFIAGVATTLLGLFILGVYVIGSKTSTYDSDYDDIALCDTVWTEPIVEAATVEVAADSIEVKGRKGYVNLTIGMSKQDVKDRLGRPITTEYSYGTETWKYEFPGEGMYGTIRVMTLEFRDGGLISINQY